MGAVNGPGEAGDEGRSAGAPPAGQEARQQVFEQLDAQRARLLSTAERVALQLLRETARRLPESVAEPMVDAGSRAVRDTTSRLRTVTTRELVRTAHGHLTARPVLALASLFGAGVLAGRLVRVAAAEAAATEAHAQSV